jgi:hypothetical protein
VASQPFLVTGMNENALSIKIKPQYMVYRWPWLARLQPPHPHSASSRRDTHGLLQPNAAQDLPNLGKVISNLNWPNSGSFGADRGSF